MLVKKSLINNWANALANIAIEEKKVDIFVEQSLFIVEVFKKHPEFISLLSIHEGSDNIRVQIIDKIFTKKDFSIEIINALKIIVERDLIFHARDIFKEVKKRLSKHQNIIFGVIWSTSELNPKNVEIIEKKISKKTNLNVRLVTKIDKSLIGGIQVIVNGENFDGSIKGKIIDMKSNILINSTNRE